MINKTETIAKKAEDTAMRGIGYPLFCEKLGLVWNVAPRFKYQLIICFVKQTI
jgi:hypothetical protein